MRRSVPRSQPDPGRWSGNPPPTFTFRWQYESAQNAWADIAGATGSTYVIQPADLGYPLRVNVTAANSAGSAEQVSVATAAVTQAPPTPPTPPGPPNDALGTPRNSRVVSVDGLQLTHFADSGQGLQSVRPYTTEVTTTAGTGDLSGPPDVATLGRSEDRFQVGFADRVTPINQASTTGRFADQTSDGTLTAYMGVQDQFSGDSYVVVSPTSETARLHADGTSDGPLTRLGTDMRIGDTVRPGQWILITGPGLAARLPVRSARFRSASGTETSPW